MKQQSQQPQQNKLETGIKKKKPPSHLDLAERDQEALLELGVEAEQPGGLPEVTAGGGERVHGRAKGGASPSKKISARGRRRKKKGTRLSNRARDYGPRASKIDPGGTRRSRPKTERGKKMEPFFSLRGSRRKAREEVGRLRLA